ncbi:hypothetical protein ACR79S_04485 [Sphingobacterium spiritivorum]|uniref:hypothetical protein n=1 Tax=Sphingobacterium spiritivorum TaxID=258 RepID=UPI003DA45348
MKTYLIFLLILNSITCTNPHTETNKDIPVNAFADTKGTSGTDAGSASDKVYICSSMTAKRYHYKESCRGLSNCGSKIVKTTIEKAKDSGKTLCGWED